MPLGDCGVSWMCGPCFLGIYCCKVDQRDVSELESRPSVPGGLVIFSVEVHFFSVCKEFPTGLASVEETGSVERSIFIMI